MSTGTYQVRGLTHPAAATINTVTGVVAKGDGSWDWTIGGVRHTYPGNNAAVNALLEEIFTGAGGFAAGTRLFGNRR